MEEGIPTNQSNLALPVSVDFFKVKLKLNQGHASTGARHLLI